MMSPGFYNMDCMDAFPQFSDKFFDLAIVDPPYGISVAKHKGGKLWGGGARKFGGKSNQSGNARAYDCVNYHTFADSHPPEESYFKELERVSKHRIIFGGNYMLDYLGKTSCMIVWDKCRRNLDQADCEIAWTDLSGQSRIFVWRWNGMLQQDMKHKEKRIHPTQKPVALYSWILEKFAKPGMKILDTHVGSASSLIACERAGLDYWGFEIDPVYYQDAMERIETERSESNRKESDLYEGNRCR